MVVLGILQPIIIITLTNTIITKIIIHQQQQLLLLLVVVAFLFKMEFANKSQIGVLLFLFPLYSCKKFLSRMIRRNFKNSQHFLHSLLLMFPSTRRHVKINSSIHPFLVNSKCYSL